MIWAADDVEFPPDCEVVVRAIWAYLDGTLDEEARKEFEAHLEWCEYCKSHTDFERRLMDEISNARREHSDPQSLEVRVRAALTAAGMESSSDGGSDPE